MYIGVANRDAVLSVPGMCVVKLKFSTTKAPLVRVGIALESSSNEWMLSPWTTYFHMIFPPGYILEWMLSVDNLFVFHMIFDIYGTPDQLKHKPLFYGIIGAIFFRMVFFVVGEALIHTLHYMHIVFGAFLVYTGVQVGLEDDEDNDPTEHPFIIWVSGWLPLVNGYDEEGRFFVRVTKDAKTGLIILPRESEKVSGEAMTERVLCLYFGGLSTRSGCIRSLLGRCLTGRNKTYYGCYTIPPSSPKHSLHNNKKSGRGRVVYGRL